MNELLKVQMFGSVKDDHGHTCYDGREDTKSQPVLSHRHPDIVKTNNMI